MCAINAQVNIALTATATHSGGGANACNAYQYNDNNLYTCASGSCGEVGWVSSNGWIQYRWSTAQNFTSVRFLKGGRPMTNCDIQVSNNGTTWTTISSNVGGGACDATVNFSASGTYLRFNQVTGTNPNFREIQVFESNCDIGEETGGESAPICTNRTFGFGSGAGETFALSQNTFYDFSWVNGINAVGFCTERLNGNATEFTTNQTCWNSGTTTSLRISSERGPSSNWTTSSSTLTYRKTTPTVNAGANQNTCNGSYNINPSVSCANVTSYARVGGTGNVNASTGAVSGIPVNSSATIRVTANNNGCTATDDVIIYNRTPAATSVSGGGVSCGSATITASGGAGGTIYFQGTTSNGTSTANASTSETVTSSGTYYFRSRSSTGGCWGAQGSVTVTIQTPPTAPTSISSSAGNTICSGTPTTLSFTGGSNGSGSTYQWYAGGCGSGSVLGTGATLSVSPTSTTTYYVRRVGNTSCTNTTTCASRTITVTPNAAVSSVSGTSPLCISETATYTTSGVVLGGGSGAWSSSNTGVATVNASGVVTAVGAGSSNITYTITGGCGGTVSENQSVTVDGTPTTADAGTAVLACLENGIVMNANNPSVGTGAWSWSPATVTYVNGTSLNDHDAEIEFNASGTYTGTWTISNGSCANSTDNVTITVNAPTTIVLSDATATCESNSINNWVHLYNASGNIIASINDNNQDLGDVTAEVFYHGGSPFEVSTSSGACGQQAVLNRSFVLNSATAPSSNVSVRLYFTDAELTNLQTLAGCGDADGCADDDDVCSITDLVVTQITGLTPSEEDGAFVAGAGTSVFHSSPTNNGTGNATFNANYLEISVSSFSEFWIHGTEHGAALPVELTMFEANAVNNKFIKLNWQTATEINNEGFEIERSTNGVDFNYIGYVNGNGNSTSIHNYEYNDEEVNANTTYYYRLKQVDYDGQFEYSEIVSASLEGKEVLSIGTIKPNPSKENTSVSTEINVGKEQEINIRIFNTIGKQVSTKLVRLEAGFNSVEINTNNLSSGTYFINFEGVFGRETKRLVIVK